MQADFRNYKSNEINLKKNKISYSQVCIKSITKSYRIPFFLHLLHGFFQREFFASRFADWFKFRDVSF